MTTRRTFSTPPAALPLWITAATGMFAARQNFAEAAVIADGRNVLLEGR
jgi:hypothetical protein